MVTAAILAGGVGSRMGAADTPKQFMSLGGKPILVHTAEKFSVHPDIDRVLVLCPKNWVSAAENMLARALGGRLTEKLNVIEGGADRNETIMRAVDYIAENFGLDDETVIVTHDAVRPFVSHRIISENVAAARKYGACDTVIGATDTIVVSENGETIAEIPARSKMYQGQTPQSFRAKKLRELYSALSDEEKKQLTDACKIYVLSGEPVHLVRGDMLNIKITYPEDMSLARSLLREEKENA